MKKMKIFLLKLLEKSIGFKKLFKIKKDKKINRLS